MEKILVSACLLGEKCTYLGTDNKQPYLEELNRYYDIVPYCPEVEGGLPTPRKPSEQRNHGVYHEDGTDVTKEFRLGAYKATQICSYLGITLAIMKERSPSCGPHFIHDGFFKGRVIEGQGETARALTQMGVKVLNEEEGLELLERLKKQEQIKDEKTRIAKAKESKPATIEVKPHGDKPRRGPKGGFKGSKPGWSYQGKTRPFAGKGKPRKKD